MVDTKTTFRLDQIEARLKALGDRQHDIANMAHENKLRLDADVQSGIDREVRLRSIETYIEQQKGRAMQNKVIWGLLIPLLGAVGGFFGELLLKHL